MRIERKGRAGRTLLAVWLFGGLPATSALAHEVDEHPDGAHTTITAEAPAPGTAVMPILASGSGGACPAQVSCGSACTAELLTGFCVLAIRWEGSIDIGPFQIGPSIEGECSICECWYRYTNSLGNSILKRATTLYCGGGSPDIEIHVQ
ncbi:MAG: hypothetical protein OEU54_12390 [Gemmatimonadota bacterium]|nr:hypothetical protein [Gemmatimonadota bacterium]